MVGPGFRFRHPNAERSGSDLLEVARSLARLAQAVPGVEWEDKKLGVALHYRRVPRRCLPRLRGLIRRMRRAGTKNRLHWTNGKKVVELRPPVAWNKGNAADLLWRRSGRPFPLVIGDDETDEDMFLAFRGKGITVCVGRKPKSGAEYFVAGPEHVHRLLKQLLGLLEKR
jgi:trehalose-phosphatase